MFSINEGLSVYRSCVLRWWGSAKQIMITVVKKNEMLTLDSNSPLTGQSTVEPR